MTGLWGGSLTQRLRLYSGLVLFAFTATHFINHALGLVSLDAMMAFQHGRVAVTRSLPGSAILLAALLVHVGLGLWKATRRRVWSMPPWQWVQTVTGVLIPVFLLPHIVNTRVANLLFGVKTNYLYELARIWPDVIVAQTLLLVLVWVHGCIGLHFWLRPWPRYAALRPVLQALAVLLPFAAFAGVSVQGRVIEAALRDSAEVARIHGATAWPDAAHQTTIVALRDNAQLAYAGGLAALALIVGAGTIVNLRRRRIPVRYVGGPLVRAEPGSTLLEISRRHNIPHVSVCGGRGRCSTCRVLVMNDGVGLSPADDAERKVLKAIGAGPHVRLACRAYPTAAVSLLPLLKAAPEAAERRADGTTTADGVERDLAVLFVDLRGFTALSERQLPFDTIYVLNEFFATVGRPVEEAGGWIANYMGDGVIALFADETGVAAACRAALLATIAIDRAVATLSARLMQETRAPLRIAMGLHAGPHVMGRVGFGQERPMSVVGLAVNVASRLETLAKTHDVQLAVSGTVAHYAGLDASGLRTEPIDVRGLSRPLDVIFVTAAGDLATRLDVPAALAPPPAA